MEIIEVTIEDVKELVGGSVDGILGTVTGLVLDLDAIVKIIADVLCVCIVYLVSNSLS